MPTGNAYFLITVTFGHINMADTMGAEGSFMSMSLLDKNFIFSFSICQDHHEKLG